MEKIHLLNILVSFLLNDIYLYFIKSKKIIENHVDEYRLISDNIYKSVILHMPNEQTQWNLEEVRRI